MLGAVDASNRHWSSLASSFEEQVRASPQAEALCFGESSIGYAELNRRSNRVAHALIARGVGAEDFVGVALERSVELIVALLGVLKSGAAWLPLDPAYPAARLRRMREEAAPVVVLDRAAFDSDWLRGGAEHDPSDAERRVPVHPRHAAYLMYTSGSTGTPKGVLVEQRAFADFLASIRDLISLVARGPPAQSSLL